MITYFKCENSKSKVKTPNCEMSISTKKSFDTIVINTKTPTPVILSVTGVRLYILPK